MNVECRRKVSSFLQADVRAFWPRRMRVNIILTYRRLNIPRLRLLKSVCRQNSITLVSGCEHKTLVLGPAQRYDDGGAAAPQHHSESNQN
jgi:hypothetical protein